MYDCSIICQPMSYQLSSDGIHRPATPVQHRNEEYDQSGFDTLWAMQEQHFWYRGRHRFLLEAIDRILPCDTVPWTGVDLGGGVGGWIRYLAARRADRFRTLALADSSETALNMAGATLPPLVERYQIDLMNLGWQSQWDCAFLLDVIEHLPDDVQAMREATQALKPGGYLFVTTPALRQFWSYNDELVHHMRRYNRDDFTHLAQASGLELCDARYFMFVLSPLYWLARKWKKTQGMSEEEKVAHVKKTHKVPSALINGALTATFAAETPLGHLLRFPWGTSILGVFRKP
jgi:SAM-dependent methyltransferase